jgi:predicted nucleic acid-binding protein
MSFLLDTNVLSEMTRQSPHPRVAKWFEQAANADLHISALTLGELRSGIDRLPNSRKRNELTMWFGDLQNAFSGRVVPIDDKVALCWGGIIGHLAKKGRKIPVVDGLLAASALTNQMVLVTRNSKDFEETGVELLDPWM